jgi:hypothetical protein
MVKTLRHMGAMDAYTSTAVEKEALAGRPPNA